MTQHAHPTAILLAKAPLRAGVGADVIQFIYKNGWVIKSHDQWVDHKRQNYFVRLEWEIQSGGIASEDVRQAFETEVALPHEMSWDIWFQQEPVQMAVFVTKEMAHLYELLMHCISGLWNAKVVLVISNHPDLEFETRRFEIPFYHIPINASNKEEHENRQLELLREANINLVVLARYMQIVSKRLIARYKNRIINIHHSMLPAFAGAKPYQQAYNRGVKLIGATSHYVTEELDAGPIIAQDVAPVTHRKSVPELMDMGRQLETKVLSQAVSLHANRRVLVEEGRTIIFD
jgi:formyltetrahydrofolate deformylase